MEVILRRPNRRLRLHLHERGQGFCPVGRSGLAGEYHGEEAILGLLERMAQLTGATLQFKPSRVLTTDDQAIVLCGQSSGTRGGKRLDADAVHILSLRGGRVREIWVFHQNQDQVDDFWSESA